jgi:hypothetical protein
MSLATPPSDADKATGVASCKALLLNHQTDLFLAHIEDYIASLDHTDAVDMLVAYSWVPPANDPNAADPADRDYQTAANADQRKLRLLHNHAFRYIRERLPEDVFALTIPLPRNVPKLLRFIRDRWHDGSDIDQDQIRLEFSQLQISNYSNIETYTSAFNSVVATMVRCRMAEGTNNGSLRFSYLKGLGTSYKVYALHAQSNSLDLRDTLPGPYATKCQNRLFPSRPS